MKVCSYLKCWVFGVLLLSFGVSFANEPVVLMGEELEKLNIKAEQAMANGDLPLARDALTRLLELSGKEIRNSRGYLELQFRLAEIEKELGNVPEAESILTDLLLKKLPVELHPSVIYLYAQILSDQGCPTKAYALFKNLSASIPSTAWSENARTFYISLEYLLNKHYEEMIRNAERLTDSGAFSEAIPMYQDVLEAIAAGSFPGVSCSPLRNTIATRLQLRCARACYEAENYALAEAVLIKQVPERSRIYEKSLHLLIMVYSKMQSFERVVDASLRYFKLGDRQLLKEYDEVEWELGHAYYMMGDKEAAKKHFLSIPQTTTNQRLYYLARLCLAQVYLSQQLYAATEDLLKSLPEQVIKENDLHYQLAYLQGEIQFYQGHYEEAAELFEMAVPVRNKKDPEWLPEILYHLALSYLKQGEKKAGDVQQQQALFNRAEERFNELLLLNNSERALLGLVRINLFRYYSFEDAAARSKAERILAESSQFQTAEGRTEFLLLQVHAYCQQGTEEAFLKAFELLEELVTVHAQVSSVVLDQDEVFYLRGLVASRLVGSTRSKDYQQIAMTSLEEVVKNFPGGHFLDAALHLLGTIYFGQEDYAQSQDFFLKVATEHPQSTYAGSAWFWAGECAHRLHKSPETIKFYRLQVFERYPTCKLAGDAYFNYYTFSEYEQGQVEAMEHLRKMPEKYPNAASLVAGYYLIGLYLKRDVDTVHLEEAIEAFGKAAALFERLYADGTMKSVDFEYYAGIRYRALLAEGLTYLSLAEQGLRGKSENALEVLQKVVDEFVSNQTTYAVLISKGSVFRPIHEEALFGLGQTYLHMKNDQMAEKIFSQMIERYQAAGVSRGHYLSRAWFELGMVAARREEYPVALKAFTHAEQAAIGNLLNVEQKLELWIQQSLCYRYLKDYDAAILLLSQIINEDVASNLRVRAMYLRAEIYELEGLKELAIKQLEAVADKEGEWALKAQEKLSRSYGFGEIAG